MSEQAVLQAVRLKGRADAAAVAKATGLAEDDVQAELERLAAAGLLKAGAAARITPEGRARLEELATAERATVDVQALTAVYEEFHAVNDGLKELMTSWQLKDADTPNDHTDAEYDGAVIERLYVLDERFRPLLERMIAIAPRLAPYRARFDLAVEQLRAGDTTYFARPIMDSYHTVWFELHEELISLLGRTRIDEALAGRAL